jgi:hypothetical protein
LIVDSILPIYTTFRRRPVLFYRFQQIINQ